MSEPRIVTLIDFDGTEHRVSLEDTLGGTAPPNWTPWVVVRGRKAYLRSTLTEAYHEATLVVLPDYPGEGE